MCVCCVLCVCVLRVCVVCVCVCVLCVVCVCVLCVVCCVLCVVCVCVCVVCCVCVWCVVCVVCDGTPPCVFLLPILLCLVDVVDIIYIYNIIYTNIHNNETNRMRLLLLLQGGGGGEAQAASIAEDPNRLSHHRSSADLQVALGTEQNQFLQSLVAAAMCDDTRAWSVLWKECPPRILFECCRHLQANAVYAADVAAQARNDLDVVKTQLQRMDQAVAEFKKEKEVLAPCIYVCMYIYIPFEDVGIICFCTFCNNPHRYD